MDALYGVATSEGREQGTRKTRCNVCAGRFTREHVWRVQSLNAYQATAKHSDTAGASAVWEAKEGGRDWHAVLGRV